MNNNIKNLFQYIKKDDLENFLNLIVNHPSLLNFKNKQNENLLFYSLQKNSYNISNYLIKNNEKFLYEKNKYLLTPYSNLIYTNDTKALIFFDKLIAPFPQLLKKCFDVNGEEYNLPLLAVSNLDIDSWKFFTQTTSHLWKNSDLTICNKEGLNIAHIIAQKNSLYCLNILEVCSNNLYEQEDYESQSTPLLIAAYNSCPEIVNYYLKKSIINKTTFFKSNIIHLGAYNKNHLTLLTLLNSGINPTEKDISNSTPLMNAINEKNEKNILSLLPYYKNLDISNEIINLIKTFVKNTKFIEKILIEVELSQLKELISNDVTSLLSYIYYSYNEEQLLKFEKNPLNNLFNFICNDKLKIHQICTSAIVGKKSMSFKINQLSKFNNFISVEDSDNYFEPIINNDSLSFKLINSPIIKYQQSFCLVALLGMLPASQINEILNSTKIQKNFSSGDLLLLYSIAIKKRSNLLLNKFLDYPKNIIINKSNADYAIQKNLSSIENFPHDNIKKSFFNILNSYTETPLYFINNISNTIINGIMPLEFLKILFSDVNNKKFKQHLTICIMNNMLNKDYNLDNLENLFSKNKKMINYFFSKIDNVDNIKNNKYLSKIFNHFSDNQLLNFVFLLEQSNNHYKNDIVNNILEKINYKNILNIKLNLYSSINDSFWKKILNHSFTQPCFNNLISLYLNHQIKYLENTELDTLKIASNYSNNNIQLTDLIYNDFKDEKVQKNTLFIIDLININKNTDIYYELSNHAFNNQNFSFLNFLCDKYSLNLNKIKLESYWQSNTLKEHFNIDILNPTYKPIENYLNFLIENKNNLNIQFWNKCSNNFYIWLMSNSSSANTKVEITYSFLSKIENNISNISNETMVNICLNLLENYHSSFKSLTDNKNLLENTLTLIFNNTNENFFVDLNKSNINLENKLPFKHRKQLNYNLLQNKLQFKVNSLPIKKRIKI